MKYGYIRMNKNHQNFDIQIDALKKYGVDEIYEETIFNRENEKSDLNELIDQLKTGDTLVVHSLDRLGRTVKQLLQLVEEFKANGIHFVSIKETIDTTTTTGAFVFDTLCSLAQMERNLISERTIEGVKKARKKGNKPGRPTVKDEKIEKALTMYYSNDYTIEKILKTTGIGKSTLYKYINQRKETNYYDGL